MFKTIFIFSLIFSLNAMSAFAHESDDSHHLGSFMPASIEKNRVKIIKDATYRYIESNGIPNHVTGKFPNKGNPNTISPQQHQYRIPLNPIKNEKARPQRGIVGVALNGIPFEPGTAEFWNGDRSSKLNYEALSGEINLGLDQHNAHVQPNGMYHYHGIPTALIDRELTLVGYAADGFPMYVSKKKKYFSSYVLRQGNRPNGDKGPYDGTFTSDYVYIHGEGNLDNCNGTEIGGQYGYVITKEFPHLPRCLYGTADKSFNKRRGPRQSVNGFDPLRGATTRPEGRRAPPQHVIDGYIPPPPHMR